MRSNDYGRLDPDRIPRHIAVIMDGNGRWATRQGLPRIHGHHQGYLALRNALVGAADLSVEVLTAYGFSSENWNRDESEVTGLMDLIHFALQAELDWMMKEGVRIIFSGRMSDLPQKVVEQFDEDMETTRENSHIILNLCLNYGGRNEITDAAKKAARLVAEGKIGVENIDDKLLSSLMYHPELPDPDLLIRTAGEMRISNFLLWQTAYTEYYSTQTLWPDFSSEDLVEAIASYQKRTRKFGAVVDEEDAN